MRATPLAALLLVACSTTTVTATVSASPQASLSTYEPSPTADPPSPSPAPFRLSVKDVDLGIKTTQKQCFGSAGCNVTVQVTLTMDKADLHAMDIADRYQVTFKVTGDDSGPIIDNLTVYGNGKYSYVEEFLSTQSPGAPVTVTATSVLKLR